MNSAQRIDEARRANPFTPVFGKVPPYLAGREDIVANVLAALEHPYGSPDSCSIFVGARGTGKTALLTYLGNEAENMGWITANVSASEGMLDDILQRVRESAAHLIADEKRHNITGIEIVSLGGISWENEPRPKGNWRSQMNELFSQLSETNTGILITVDEVDPALPEMEQLAATYQHFVREGKKAMLLMAGLPHRVSALLSGRSTSFLRRAARHKLGPIPSYEVKEAFRLTVESGGRMIDDAALDEAVLAIDGFPFMFQLVGYRSWNVAASHASIRRSDVSRGAALAEEELEDRVFTATFAELSKGDIAFLRAMAQDDGPSRREDVAKRLGKSSSYVSTYKKRLLDGGLIEEPRRGMFTFALPKLREYVRAIDEE